MCEDSVCTNGDASRLNTRGNMHKSALRWIDGELCPPAMIAYTDCVVA